MIKLKNSFSPGENCNDTITNNNIEIFTFRAIESTEITNMKSSDVNFSGKKNILLNCGPDRMREGMFKFEVKGINNKVLRAKLKIYVDALLKNTPSKPVLVSGVPTEWKEELLTWNNCPVGTYWSGEFRRMPVIKDWMEADVTEYVKGNGIYSFRLRMQEEVGISIASSRYDDTRFTPCLEIISGTGELPPEEDPPVIDPVSTVVLNPSDIVFISEAQTCANPEKIELAGQPSEKVAYLAFEVKGMNCDVLGTKLRLFYSEGRKKPCRLSVFSTGNNWSSESISWKNMPEALPLKPLAEIEVPEEAGWIEIEFENYITGTGKYSFIVKTDSKTLLKFGNCIIENNLPELIVRYRDGLNKTEEEVEKVAQEIVERYIDKELIGYGIIDVTKYPYCADNTGKEDATLALQRAINESRDAKCVTYLPAGTYLVSGQLEGRSPNYTSRQMAKQIMTRKNYGCILKGPSDPDNRAVIKLAPNAEEFKNPLKPVPVLYFWAVVGFPPNIYSKSNINWSSQIIDIDLDLNGNSGAIGIDFAACELAALQCVKINAEGAFAGIKDGLGSGGGMHDITVIGGKYGIYITKSQPTCSLSNATLTKQVRASVYNNSVGPLVMPGAVIKPAPGAMAVEIAKEGNDTSSRGSVCLIDSRIEMASGADVPAIYGHKSVFLKNVYVKNAGIIVKVEDVLENRSIKGNPNGWCYVRECAIAANVSHAYEYQGRKVRKDSIYIDGTSINGFSEDVTRDGINEEDIPGDLQSRHTWKGVFPYWGDENILNARDFGACGNSSENDCEDQYPALQKAIDVASEKDVPLFIPKGVYKISKTLELRSNSRIIGVSHLSAIIEPIVDPIRFPEGDFLNAADPKPLVKTVDDRDATTILAFVQLRVRTLASQGLSTPYATSYGLLWQAGRNSIIRNAFPRRIKLTGEGVDSRVPTVVFRGNGGGKAYVLSVADATRMTGEYYQCLVDGTTEPLIIYHFQPQMGDVEAVGKFGCIIRNAENIDIFGVKFEGEGEAIIKTENCDNIRIFGSSGGGSPESYFKFLNCQRFIVSNVFPMDGKIKPGCRDLVKENEVGTGDINHIILYKRGDL